MTKRFTDARQLQVWRVQEAIESYKRQLSLSDGAAIALREPHHSEDSEAVDSLDDLAWLALRRAVLRGGIEALERRLAEDRPWPNALRPVVVEPSEVSNADD